MSKLIDIEKESNEFFQKHWDKSASAPMPEWKSSWPWQGSVPHHDKAGVYALIDGNEEVIYIGLGASRGGGAYAEHGISRRLLQHVITTNKEKGRGNYMPQEKWNEVRDIAAIGFNADYSYLAPALEDYLIGKFNPPRNKVKKKEQ